METRAKFIRMLRMKKNLLAFPISLTVFLYDLCVQTRFKYLATILSEMLLPTQKSSSKYHTFDVVPPWIFRIMDSRTIRSFALLLNLAYDKIKEDTQFVQPSKLQSGSPPVGMDQSAQIFHLFQSFLFLAGPPTLWTNQDENSVSSTKQRFFDSQH